MSVRRTAILGVAALAVVTLSVAGCSSDKDSSSSSTTASVGAVIAPTILTPTQTSATVKVGNVVVFDMGDLNGGTFVATSDNEKVFKVDSIGRTEGGTTYNAGGKALAAGKANVVVQFKGSANGLGTPTTFTITVE
jgi:hypothetical protein